MTCPEIQSGDLGTAHSVAIGATEHRRSLDILLLYSCYATFAIVSAILVNCGCCQYIYTVQPNSERSPAKDFI